MTLVADQDRGDAEEGDDRADHSGQDVEGVADPLDVVGRGRDDLAGGHLLGQVGAEVGRPADQQLLDAGCPR